MITKEVERVTRILAKVDDIPTLPTSLAQVLRLIDDPECTVNKLGTLVSGDPAFAARVLRLANSSYYGFPRAIAGVPQAITLLGFATLRNVALSTAVFDLVFSRRPFALDLEALWKHSVGVATAGKIVAQYVRYSPHEQAFTAGLLHDMGKLLIARYLRDQMNEILYIVRTEGMAMVDAEYRVMRMSHSAFGAWLAARWAFPASLVDAIAFHHHPLRAGENAPLAAITCVADVLARRAGIGSGGDDIPRELDPQVLQLLGLSPAHLNELTETMKERKNDIDAFATSLRKI